VGRSTKTEKIIGIKRVGADTVYNISVLNDESYTANGIIVHNCRSAIIPVTMFTEVKDSWRYENRDFSKPMNQDFSFSSTEIDSKIVKQAFKNIDTFNEKYRIDRWIFDEDLEKRYLRLGVGVNYDNKNEYLSKKLDNYNWKLDSLKKKYEKTPTKAIFKDITLMEDNITELKEEIKILKKAEA
jgi:hypothetical protein